jgi:hypothetical protein
VTPRTGWWIEAALGAGLVLWPSSCLPVAQSDKPPPEPPPLYTCPRTLPGGYELLSMRLTAAGVEHDCRYVKHGVR